MKRIVFIVLTIIAFASLSACGTNSNTTVDDAERVAESTSEKSAVLTVDADNAQKRCEILQSYRFDDAVNQILIISHTTEWDAKAWFYEKQEVNNAWILTFETDAFIGNNGMNKTKEGDAKTPVGDYEITGAFGILPNPGTSLNYYDIKPTTYACDEACEYYNQIIDTQATGHDCNGEEMFKMSPEYNYGLTTNYNEENIYPNGSAIFIHCKGQKPFTGGCIALDEEYMEMILKSAEEGMHIYLDEYYSKE